MNGNCKRCGHAKEHHTSTMGYPCACKVATCHCCSFTSVDDPSRDPMERIVVALESIARSLDAMRREGR